MGIFIGFIVVVVIAIVFLKQFDKVSGRGPKQVTDGINRSNIGRQNSEPDRIPCPECAEMILPAARKCPFCKSEIKYSRGINVKIEPQKTQPPKYVPCPQCEQLILASAIEKGLRECPKCKNAFTVE